MRALPVAVAVVLLAGVAAAPASAVDPAPARTFTILHTNDFHGQLEPSGSNPGAARVANTVNTVRTAVGPDNVLLLDAGDRMQGSLLSNIQKGLPTVDFFRTLGYDAGTFGNHEFDWGQTVLGERIAQAVAPAAGDESPMAQVVANITRKVDDACTWTPFNDDVDAWTTLTVGTGANTSQVAVIGVGSVETPYITVAEATAGLCFRDPAETIVHYYDDMAAASDAIVVLSHNGYTDGGYGYGITVYGDQTLATKLNTAGKPVDLIIGGHSHTDLAAATMVGNTAVVQAHYNGRKVGRADVSISAGGVVSVTWTRLSVGTSDPKDPTVDALVTAYATDPAYVALVNQPVGYTKVDLLRNYNGDNMLGDFVDDAIYGALNDDADPANDVDMFFNNPGGLRIDWCDKEDPANPGTYIWTSTAADCQAQGTWTHDPMLLTYGQMFQILPFGNATAVGRMTGAQIQDLLNQSATLFKGALQPSGIRYSFFRYSDANPGPQPYGWGAYDIEVYDQGTSTWKPLDLAKTYKVGTNEFLAPAGQDGFAPFKYMTGISYWGDMLDAVNAYVAANHGTPETAYNGPTGDGMLDGRIARNGDDTFTPGSGEIVPLTVLHHNDSHGNLAKGTFVGYTQLASIVKQERAHNPTRTLLLSGGDNVQGDAMMYFYKSAPLGYASDGSALDPALQTHPMMAAMNSLGYDAMTLGNHEFNFGSEVYKGIMAQAEFPVLGANVSDDGRYGLAVTNDGAGVQPYVEKTLDGIDVAIVGITNHRVPNYELPSNIVGLTFSDPLAAAADTVGDVRAGNDVVIALSHLGFTENPASVEVDTNVDTNLAAQVGGIDAIVGAHSHTNPATGFGAYKFLPTIVAGPDGDPVLINHAYRYNNTVGEISMGLAPLPGGGYELVSQAGRYISVATATPEDAPTKAIVDPYVARLVQYNNTVVGTTTAPIDALQAFTQETTGANLQADASVWKLESEGIDVDIHISGAMTNRAVAAGATEASPATLKVSDMFTAMPYENSLVVMDMNGPQLKAVLERAYRNYYYYKYVPGYGGYSYYTTCMLDTDAMGRIVYRDTFPTLPDGQNVEAFFIGGEQVDFADAATYYRVSTVNYLAAGSCNFNNGGVTLWPLDQIVADTQYYVRDAVIEYISDMGTVSPAIEGRLRFAKVVSSTGNAGEGSLRSAIADANGAGGYQAIVIDVAGAIGLDSVLPEVTGDLMVFGPGADDLALVGDGRRILKVGPGATLWLEGLTLRDGRVARGSDGGAILNLGTLSVNDSVFKGNAADNGGAIASRDGGLSVSRSTFTGNQAYTSGGAIAGAGHVSLEASTFAGNRATNNGGALAFTGSHLEVVNSTAAGNVAGAYGGGFDVATGEASIRSSTLAGNGATWAEGFGGNLAVGDADLVLENSIVALAMSGGDCAMAGGFEDDRFNLVGDGSCDTGSPSRLTGDPHLGPLADNGGPTMTMALLAPSVAIDAGANDRCPATDQRGDTRALSGADACDLGAYETTDRTVPTATAPAATLRVDATMSGTAAPVRLTWTGADTGSGVARYEVQKKVGSGSWMVVSDDVTSTSLNARISTTSSTWFRVRAVDRVGNMGAWATGPAINAALVQQAGAGTTYGPGWTTASGSAYSGGSVAYGTAKGTWMTIRFTGRTLALVTTEAPKRGVVKVLVNGNLAATIDLAAASRADQVVVWQRTWGSSATRTIKLVVQGTTDRPRVDVDAFLVMQ